MNGHHLDALGLAALEVRVVLWGREAFTVTSRLDRATGKPAAARSSGGWSTHFEQYGELELTLN